MKKLIFAFVLLLVAGAGCVSLPGVPKKEVLGDWQLAFDLPAGWDMVRPYDVDSTTPINTTVVRNIAEVVVQSQANKLCYSAGRACEDTSAAAPTDSDVRIQASFLDARRVVATDEMEALGNGFFRVKLCEATEDCTLGNKGNYEYYLVLGDAKYKFTYYGNSTAAESVILSAQVVTKFTDTVDDKAE